MCRYMIKSQMWRTDPSCSRPLVYLCCAAALDGLHRRAEAIVFLGEAVEAHPGEPQSGWLLMLAKLLFRENRKQEAWERCAQVIASYERGDASVDDAADAYHLAGWAKIHDDDHSGAYAVWSRGHAVAPSCPILRRQHAKRLCWDSTDESGCDDGLLGGGAHVDGAFVAETDLEAFAAVRPTHALALFERSVQRGRLVFRTRRPLLTPAECDGVLRHVHAYHAAERGGVWGTVRDSSVHTTDVAVEDIPALRPWLRRLLRRVLYPMVAAAFPTLADGTSTLDASTGESRMRVHDAFIVRYDSADASLSLPEHSDTSAVSFTLALNSAARGDFRGGGTWFEALGERGGRVVDAEQGHAVAFAGPLRHAGYPITDGCRMILVLFLYVEGFPYGGLVATHLAEQQQHGGGGGEEECAGRRPAAVRGGGDEDEGGVRPSGDRANGFVVYKQTTELVKMLNKQPPSVLD